MADQHDIIVVGSGIAGLTAGLTAARCGRHTLVLTGDTLGGHLLSIEKIDGFPGFVEGAAGYDLCPGIQEQAAEAGAEFLMAPASRLSYADGLWQVESASGRHAARAVILATGTTLRSIDVPGEELLRGKGVSQCASCDAPLLRGKPVVVAGGGDSAAQEALTLAEHCSHVTIVHHGGQLAAQQAYVDQIDANAKIELASDSEIVEILGKDGVTGVSVAASGGGDPRQIECEGVFVFVGLKPNAQIVHDSAVLDAAGGIATDGLLRTSSPGLLAAGTVRARSVCRAASAAGEGASAALAADAFLADGTWPA